MARSALPLILLLLFAILLSNSCQGDGRRVKVMVSSNSRERLLLEVGRMMEEMTVMDYKEPGANTNPRGGPLLIFPPSPSPPLPP